jgi:hypothetical protein
LTAEMFDDNDARPTLRDPSDVPDAPMQIERTFMKLERQPLEIPGKVVTGLENT